MKTTDPRDPLDQTIDRLLGSRPLAPRGDFVDAVVDATAAAPSASPARTILRFALPVAAAIAVAFIAVTNLPTTSQPEAVAIGNDFTLEEVDEILLLQEGLAGLAQYAENGSTDTSLMEALVNDYTS